MIVELISIYIWYRKLMFFLYPFFIWDNMYYLNSNLNLSYIVQFLFSILCLIDITVRQIYVYIYSKNLSFFISSKLSFFRHQTSIIEIYLMIIVKENQNNLKKYYLLLVVIAQDEQN